MIKTIIKRNGKKEDFSASKINGWGEWAAKTLGNKVDWSSIVLEVTSTLPSEVTSQELHNALIRACLDMDTWSYNRMAGRLYATQRFKELYNNNIPTVQEVHKRLYDAGLMVKLSYSDEEYAKINTFINHDLDLKATHFELHQIRNKYSLQSRVTGEEYESQQFVYMRMAMALAEDETDPAERLLHVEKWYEHLSKKRINAPTPNFVNLGTSLKGYASCCVYTSDDTADSIEAGVHIAYTMTHRSAGIGAHMSTRSLRDPVRGGLIPHQGKLPYFRYTAFASRANLQAGRGGAVTMYINCYDPEIETMLQLKNPMSHESAKIREMDYGFSFNRFFVEKAGKNEDIFLFNVHTAPDLYNALYSEDETEFRRLYAKYEADENFHKKYISARYILVLALTEAYETGRIYEFNTFENNNHTPFKDTIYSSNLCNEIALPTKGYSDVTELYKEDGDGEIGLCSLAGIVYPNIDSDEQLEEVMYYALKMIDKTIHMSDYPFPQLEKTAKSRLSAGIGIIGLAHYMAKNKLSYSTQEGRDEIHRLSERHMYFALRASLRLSKELGVAPWMNKTKWPDGWLPIDTYNKNVDKIVTTSLQYDWEALRKEIVENGGIRNSVLVAHMPSETSSISAGTTNGVYPVRHLTLIKGDNTNRTYWSAPDSDKIGKYYDIAYDIEQSDLTKCYGIIQKFTDQAISADIYDNILGSSKLSSTQLISEFLNRVRYGMKGRYYINSRTTLGTDMDSLAEEVCESCTL